MSATVLSTAKRPFGDRSIRFKLVAVMLAIAALTLALAGGAILLHARSSFDRQVADHLRTVGHVIGLNSARALATEDAKTADETLAALRGDAQVLAAALYLADGRLFATYFRERGRLELPDRLDLLARYERAGGQVQLTDLVFFDDRPVGALHLVADMTRWGETWQSYTSILAALFLAILAIGLPLSVWLQRFFSRPVLELAGLMRRIARERDYRLRARKFADDELGALVDGFNDMLAQIERRRAEVEQAREELERRVHELNVEMGERERAEAALRASEERERAHAADLQTVLEAVPAVVFVARDRECRTITANRAGYELLRLPAGHNASKTASAGEAPRHFRVLQEGRELADEELPVQRVARTGVPLRNFEEEVLLDDGTRHELFGNVEPLLDDAGRPRGAVGYSWISVRASARRKRCARARSATAPSCRPPPPSCGRPIPTAGLSSRSPTGKLTPARPSSSTASTAGSMLSIPRTGSGRASGGKTPGVRAVRTSSKGASGTPAAGAIVISPSARSRCGARTA